MAEYTLGKVEDFPEGEGCGLVVDGLTVAVFRDDGEFYAVSGICPHKNGPLWEAGSKRFNSEGREATERGRFDPEAGVIECPWHNQVFDLDTGRHAPTGTRIRRFEVDVEDGEVVLTV